ncbi:MAG: septal ring lytic transglycosylase RlpA family protein [Treponema sp.]|nr:septal ring lytic transglycosylase RlpA family protein [Treponema sp.]
MLLYFISLQICKKNTENLFMKPIFKFVLFFTILIFSPLYAQELYKAKAVASFYGADFHGKKTSNGEIFDMNAFTCANKELPFNTILKVTYLKNGKSVNVRVNDRGPFVIGRDIDLSTAAAKSLGMTGAGLAEVKLEIIKKGPDTKLSRDTAASAKKIMAKKQAASGNKTQIEKEPEKGKIWDIQLGSFSSKDNAKALAKKLSKEGFTGIVLKTTKAGVVRVCISRVPSETLTSTKQKLTALGYKDFIISERKQ